MKKPVYLFLFLFHFLLFQVVKKSESSAPNFIYVLADDLDLVTLAIIENKKLEIPIIILHSKKGKS